MATNTGFTNGGGALGSRQRAVRYVAAAGAALAAMIYLLIGFGAVWIGQSSSGGTPDLPGFGLTVGGALAVMALLLLLVDRRIVWVPAARLDLGVIVGYFVPAGLREPPYELWGLLVKAFQVTLGALAYLIVHGPVAGG